MEDKKDAFGRMVWDFYNGRPSFEAVEMDTGFLTAISPGPEWYFENYEDWSEIEKKAVEKAEGKVLDIGCGAGRHSLHLQEEGHEVLATDISPLALRTAEERGVERTRELDLNDIDLLKEEFDTVLMLGNNFGLVGSEENGRSFLKKLQEITTSKARLIAECEPCTDKEKERYHETEEGLHYLEMRYRYKQYISDFHRLLHLSKEDLEEILRPVNWEVENIIDHERSASYIAVIVKS